MFVRGPIERSNIADELVERSGRAVFNNDERQHNNEIIV